jgi:hypothetical protein
MRMPLCAASVCLLATLSAPITLAQNPRFKDLDALAQYFKSTHKAPFDRDGVRLPTGAAAALVTRPARAPLLDAGVKGTNIKVNQDRNPWPKAEIGAAVDPLTGKDYVVMTNDFRENWDHMFYHVSTNAGKSWTDDSMVGGADPVTGFVPLTFQSDPGVAFDALGHSFLSTITGNSILDFVNGYENFDTEIEVAQGFANGTYTLLLPTPIDDQPCSGLFVGPITCNAQLDKPLITVDNVASSPNNGTIYVYYTLFCSSNQCTDGNAVAPPFSSVILESHSAGAGLPFSPPSLVSGNFFNTQFSNLVVDSHGEPHIFFDDFTAPFPKVNMYESTLTGGTWVVSPSPVATFSFVRFGSINWGFRSSGTVAPGCGIYVDTAYCAFSANQVAGGKAEGGVSAYVAVVDTQNGSSSVHRVNNDPFGTGKDHFFPWATAKSDGSVYVGWYDDRKDPFNTLVGYWVGKSTDGGNAFQTQKQVSDTTFNPCVGFPGCSFFGDYTQLVAGQNGVVHAAWSDTRDNASMHIFSQAISW